MPPDDVAANEQSSALQFGANVRGSELRELPYDGELDHRDL
jgi:hypothetical protein